MYINDCSDNCIQAVEKYFLSKGYLILNIEPQTGLNNLYYGDLKLTLFKDKASTICIDFKKQTRRRDYIQIELIQVSKNNSYNSWLYNDNIHYCVYEFLNGDCYIFTHNELISIAKLNNNDTMWESCIVYRNNKEAYTAERKWVDSQLEKYKRLTVTNIKADHINGAFNYRHGNKKIHSGFCVNLSLNDAVEHLI